jgi:hypothetical protein
MLKLSTKFGAVPVTEVIVAFGAIPAPLTLQPIRELGDGGNVKSGEYTVIRDVVVTIFPPKVRLTPDTV